VGGGLQTLARGSRDDLAEGRPAEPRERRGGRRGVIGTSVAFHLAEAGVPDVVLVERDELGAGSTSKAAGGVRAQFSDAVNIQLGARSLRAFADFGARPGQEIDFRPVGYLFLLSRPEDVAAFERSIKLQNQLGVPSRLGAHIETACELLDVRLGGEAIQAAVTSKGEVETPALVCAAGAWSRQVGAMVGVDLPVTPYRRQVLLTEPVPGLPERLPMTIDFASSFYFHREGPGLLMGMSLDDEPPGFNLGRDDAWIPRLAEVIVRRAPSLAEVGIAGGWAGLYEVTPDHNALIGEAARPPGCCMRPASPGMASSRAPLSVRSCEICSSAGDRPSTSPRWPRTGSSKPGIGPS